MGGLLLSVHECVLFGIMCACVLYIVRLIEICCRALDKGVRFIFEAASGEDYLVLCVVYRYVAVYR